MRRVLLALALAFGLVAGFAHAADKPVIGPPGDWVKPMSFVPPKGGDTEAATRLLATDQQVHFGPDGETTYVASYVRIQTAQGLAAVGTIALPWKPDSMTLTVHRLRILRGDKVIDVLANQEFTVLRRENRLEYAMLDGVLTATIQPEGLEVGDILELAISLNVNDPVMAGLSSDLLSGIPDEPIDQARLRLVWAQPKVLKWRITEGIDTPKVTTEGGRTEVLFPIRNLQPWRVPDNAPARFRYGRVIEVSEFTSWAQVSALFNPLYDKAATLSPTSPVRAEIDRIRSATSDPVERATAALALVQGKTRYVFLGMNDGGLTPASADSTWSRRYGDCKGKTALLLAILRELGVDAQPAVVSTTAGDGLDQRLPVPGIFDHVLVRASIKGKVYWLDGTRSGDASLADIAVPPFRWALPIQPKDAVLVRLDPAPLDRPDVLTIIKIDASAGLDTPAPIHAEYKFRGSDGLTMGQGLANLSATDREIAMRKIWQDAFDFVTVKSTTYSLDSKTSELILGMDGLAKMDWQARDGTVSRFYEADVARLGMKVDLKREPGPHRDAPYVNSHPIYVSSAETIVLPQNAEGFSVEGKVFDETIGGTVYRRKATISGGVFSMEATARSLEGEFPASAAPAVEKALAALLSERLFVKAPASYVRTAKDRAAMLATEPDDFGSFNDRGLASLQSGAYDKAIEDFTRALSFEPDSALAYSNRGLSYAHAGNLEAAKADVKKALQLDPNQIYAAQAAGLIAEAEQRFADAVSEYSRFLARNPDDLYSLSRRATAYALDEKYDKALVDVDAYLKAAPKSPEMLGFRAMLHAELGNKEAALADLKAAEAASPQPQTLRFSRAQTFWIMDRKDEALALVDTLIREKPTAELYTWRFRVRSEADVAGKIIDLDGILRLDPRNVQFLVIRASYLSEQKSYEKARADLTQALAIEPGNANLFVARAAAWAASGQTDKALADFALARKAANGNATALNNLCWSQATLNIALEAALGDCDAALKLEPRSAALIDSRAFVLLRLGRLEESIAAYDAALKIAPKQEASLYGRGLARLRMGQEAEGRADIAAAQKVSDVVAARFAEFGLSAAEK